MTRRRSTWNNTGTRQAATSRKADIYTMNQPHPQPSPVEYENGNPDQWAETPTTNQNVQGDYDGDRVRRNEIGLGEFRQDTFSHKDSDKWSGPGKYDNQKLAMERKASLAERIARATLRTEDDKLVKAQAMDLMALPIKSLQATAQRINLVSPDALGKDAKYRRALACCKIASQIVGTNENLIERLASVLMQIDNPTLREIIKISAQAQLAAKEEEDEKEEKTSSEKEEEDEDEDEDEKTSSDKCLSSEEENMLEVMLKEEACDAAPAPADLTSLFNAPIVQGPAVPAQQLPVAFDAPEISFDDSDEPVHFTASDSNLLQNLFSDNEEVQAQREITAAQSEQTERGYAGARTASVGARKLGTVKRQTTPKDDELASIWE